MMLSSVKVTDTVSVVSSGLSGDRAARSASICSCGMPWAALAWPICCAMPPAARTGLTIASGSRKSPVALSSSSMESTSAITAGSSRRLPSGALTTMVPLGTLIASSSVPKRSFISSWVTVESMSGMENVGLGDFAKFAAPKPRAPKRMSQMAGNGQTFR